MELAGWILDKSATARASDPAIGRMLAELAGSLFVCPIGELEQLYSARSATDYDELRVALHAAFRVVAAPPDLFDRALRLQRDLAHHHGMWHRTPIPDLLIAEVRPLLLAPISVPAAGWTVTARAALGRCRDEYSLERCRVFQGERHGP